jgi:hypothetical protein
VNDPRLVNNSLPQSTFQPTGKAQLVVIKPGKEPVVEGGFSMKVNSNNVNLQPVRSASKTYVAPGTQLGQSEFNVQGTPYSYQVILREGGLEIKPLSNSSARYLDTNRSQVLRTGLLESVQNLGANPGNIETIYFNYK